MVLLRPALSICSIEVSNYVTHLLTHIQAARLQFSMYTECTCALEFLQDLMLVVFADQHACHGSAQVLSEHFDTQMSQPQVLSHKNGNEYKLRHEGARSYCM